MISLRIPEISNIAGINSDGIFIGAINQINPTAVLMGETLEFSISRGTVYNKLREFNISNKKGSSKVCPI